MTIQRKKNVEVSVKVVFKSGNAVMFHQTDGGIRDLPGGHVEFGETTIEALRRELKEELGFARRVVPQLIHVWTYLSSNGNVHRINIVYLIDVGKKRPNLKHRERNDLKFIWLKKNEIKPRGFLQGMEESLLKATCSGGRSLVR